MKVADYESNPKALLVLLGVTEQRLPIKGVLQWTQGARPLGISLFNHWLENAWRRAGPCLKTEARPENSHSWKLN